MLLSKSFQHIVFDFRAAWKHDVALIGMKDWGGWQSCLAEKTAWIIIIFCCWRSNTNVSQGFIDSFRLDFNLISSLDQNESIVETSMLWDHTLYSLFKNHSVNCLYKCDRNIHYCILEVSEADKCWHTVKQRRAWLLSEGFHFLPYVLFGCSIFIKKNYGITRNFLPNDVLILNGKENKEAGAICAIWQSHITFCNFIVSSQAC